MLSSVLKSDKAIQMNILIMRTFVEIRQLLLNEYSFTTELLELWKRVGEHDAQLSEIYLAIEHLRKLNLADKNWRERDRIGFKKSRNEITVQCD